MLVIESQACIYYVFTIFYPTEPSSLYPSPQNLFSHAFNFWQTWMASTRTWHTHVKWVLKTSSLQGSLVNLAVPLVKLCHSPLPLPPIVNEAFIVTLGSKDATYATAHQAVVASAIIPQYVIWSAFRTDQSHCV